MKIIGNTVGTTMKRPDFNQTDPKKSDYIKNNPLPPITEEDEGKALVVKDGGLVLQPVGGGGGDAPSGDCNLPSCDSTNEGQFLRVVNGTAAWATVPRAEDTRF